MRFTELLKELQGNMSQQEFGDKVGITQGTISRIILGSRRPGREVLTALVSTFPERKQELIESFFALEYDNRSEISPNVITEPADAFVATFVPEAPHA